MRYNYCETDPLFVAWPTGTWTTSGTYDAAAGESTFYDAAATWPVNGLVGRFLEPDTANAVPVRALIVANTATTITALGDVATYGVVGDPYEITDYHLSAASPCIDTGDPTFVPGVGETDLDDCLRVADGTGDGSVVVDGGACEYLSPRRVPPDFDADGDVDLADFVQFQLCFNGPNRPARDTCTVDADFDNDADVDLSDFNVFQGCFNGPNRPPRCQ